MCFNGKWISIPTILCWEIIDANIQVKQKQNKCMLNSFYMWGQSEYYYWFLDVFYFLAWKVATFNLIFLFLAILVITATLLRINNNKKINTIPTNTNITMHTCVIINSLNLIYEPRTTCSIDNSQSDGTKVRHPGLGPN